MTLVVTGDLDLMTVPMFEGAARSAINEYPQASLRLDLTAVGFIDSTGINALVALQTSEQERGKHLELAASSTYVERVLRLVGLDDMFV
ncbi:MAG: STAS domain-containing protein [Marmoricola sp.]